jgi:hypothetical protein
MDGQESRKRLATELRQKQKNKQKNLPRTNTELHGKDRGRDTEGRISRSRRLATELHGKTRK